PATCTLFPYTTLFRSMLQTIVARLVVELDNHDMVLTIVSSRTVDSPLVTSIALFVGRGLGALRVILVTKLDNDGILFGRTSERRSEEHTSELQSRENL